MGLSALLGLAVAAFCLLTRRPMLRLLFGAITDDVMDAAVIYFTITALSFPFWRCITQVRPFSAPPATALCP